MATKEKKEKKSSRSKVDSDAAEPAPSTKRKASVEEIEIDVAAPEPPSKRARRALKKGKALPAKVGSDDEGKDGENGDGKDKKEKARSEHGVWIGNLPFTVTPVELRKWLVDNSGGVLTDEMMTRVKLPTVKEPGRDKNAKPANKGFAYVDFTDISGKVAAIALSETELAGRKLLIKDSKSFEGRPEKPKEPAEGDAAADGKMTQTKVEQRQELNASRKVFVGNMSFKTTDEDLSRNFEKCGEIEWVKVATFEDTGKCKGFGWVKFKEPEAAAWAVKGFVKIKEEVETEDDFKNPEDKDDEDEAAAAPKEKQFKTRKWWINRMLGRELKIELAEDDQVRYKKRFGKDKDKDGPKRTDGSRKPGPRQGGRRGGDYNNKQEDGDSADRDVVMADGPSKPLKEAEDISVARLTGAVVKHTGTKMTFD